MATVYDLFASYFGEIELQRVQDTDNGYTIYACGIATDRPEFKVIYAIVPFRYARDARTTLSQLPWVSLQTRTTDEPLAPGVPTHSFIPSRAAREQLTIVFDAVNRSPQKTDYRTPEIPLEMSIIHDPKKNNFLQCPDRVRLYSALETFRCVVTML